MGVIDGGLGNAVRERPLRVTNAVGPGIENLTPGPRRHFFRGEALDNAEATLDVGAQRGADFRNDGPLVAMGNRNLFTGWEHRKISF
jgi:hypothetical protein